MTFTKKLLAILVENRSCTFKAQNYFRKAQLTVFFFNYTKCWYNNICM